MKTIYELREDFLNLDVLISEQPAELDAELALELDRLFADFANEEADKLESYYRLIRRLEMESSAAVAEAEQYEKMANDRDKLAAKLRDRIKGYLEFTKRTKATTASGKTFAIQANGGLEPLKIDPGTAVADIDEWLVKVVKSIDTTAVRNAIKAGETFDWATLEPRGTHLRIK